MYFLAHGTESQWWSPEFRTKGEHNGAINLNLKVGPARSPADSPSTPDDARIVGDIQSVDACRPPGPRGNEVPWNGDTQETRFRADCSCDASTCHSVLDEL